LTPACAPRLLDGGATLRTPRDLSKFTLLHSTEDRRDWKLWVEAFDIRDADVMTGQIYSSLDMATQAAVLGEGVVLGDLTFMQDEIASGRLVLPFKDKVVRDEAEAYHVACRAESWSDPRVAAFFAWLFDERDRMQPGPGAEIPAQ
jgi:LysR family glycine cleavage system transcriptional activator